MNKTDNSFKEVFSRIFAEAPTKTGNHPILKTSWLDTPLGQMIAVSNEETLYLLEFVDRRGLEKELEWFRKKTKAAFTPGETKPIASIEKELHLYFKGKLTNFKTPLFRLGSPFQKQVWEELSKIPMGETRSYAEIAKAIKRPTAFRAAAQAIGSNQLAIIIPCHRVINTNGGLGGYAGGLPRKKWLLQHEGVC